MASSSSKRIILAMGILGVFMVMFAFCAGVAGSLIGSRLFSSGIFSAVNIATNSAPASDSQSSIVNVATKASSSVVSIVISKNVSQLQQDLSNPFSNSPFFQYYYGSPQTPQSQPQSGGSSSTQLQQVGAGSGFIISTDGLILTNRHVVEDTTATYTAILNDGTQLPATVIARDTVLDIAMVKITTDKPLTPLTLGDSDTVKIGQTAVAIGNSLGEFSNTVSAGIISGLSRSITASDGTGASSEQLTNVMQTDASINPGNSGGPLLDIDGKVIGVNVAIAQDAQNIGFAIPINSIKTIVQSVSTTGKIVRPYLGVRYLPVDDALVKQYSLSVTYGAYVLTDTGANAGVIVGGPADKAGIKGGDVITSINSQKLDTTHDLQTLVQQFKVGDTIAVTVQRGTQQLNLNVTLLERPAQ